MTKANQPSYRELNDELEALLLELQRDDLDIDTALQHYRRGLEIVTQLEAYLKTAENSIKKLQARPKPES